ncbi:glycosyl transferase [Bacteroidales bacterium]|nr:glycosyl transferase [Bacteroidales bacterium]
MDTNKPPLISIITVTYNAQSVLEQTIQSVINQTYKNIEYIIVDGGSTDGTLEIIIKYKSQISSWISEKDKGIYDAMNKGIRMAKGSLIGMINAGDFYMPKTVELVWEASLKNPLVGIFHGKINLLEENGDLIKIKTPNTDLSCLSQGMCVYHPTFFVSKAIYELNGLYDTEFKIAADFDFTLRNYLSKTSFYYIDELLANFKIGGLSHVQNIKAIDEVVKSLIKNGYSQSDVQKTNSFLLKKDKRNQRMFLWHSIFKKILPRFVLQKMAQSIKK